jgi:small subunit ribosomal protein S9
MEVINATGRRKTAIARVFVKDGKGEIRVNNKDFKVYFPTTVLQYIVEEPFAVVESLGKFDVTASVEGGGFKGQAGALSLALSRALCKINPENRPPLKAKELLRRDPRMVERKKPGQKKARKRFQFSKR